MKFKKLSLPALFAGTLFAAITTSNSAHAWGQTGHRVTGQIAEHYLTPEARHAIDRLLPNENLAEASTYADEMRSNPEKFWQETSKGWHYVTIPEGKTYKTATHPHSGDAYTALAQFSETLKNDQASLKDKQVALRFIIHIVGDLHQPLHAGNGTDRGGNDQKLEFFWEESNLHRVWDSGLLDKRQLSYSEWADWLSKKISAEQYTLWNNADPLVWIDESMKIRDTIYPQGDKLSWDYLYEHLPTAKRRLQQGGVRMAAYLNALFEK